MAAIAALCALVACSARGPVDEAAPAPGDVTFPSSPAVVVAETCAEIPDGAPCELEDGGAGACAHVPEPEAPDFGRRFCAAAGPPCGAVPPAGGCLCALDCPTPSPGSSAVCKNGVCDVE